MVKIIAYSLFIMDDCHSYDIDLYITGVNENYLKMRELAPDFKMVIYCDETVDIKNFLDEIEFVRIEHNQKNTFYMTMARFLAFSYSDAELVLIRDLDNILTREDFRVISRWIRRSNKCFHRYILKNYKRELIASGIAFRPKLFLGSLFSGKDLMEINGKYKYGCDEEYLERVLYPKIKDDLTSTEIVPDLKSYAGYLKCSDNVFPIRNI